MVIGMNPKCVLCDVNIREDNDTEEHIIPNSIGGRKKVKGFICNTCNRKSGDSWETALAKQLNPLSLFFRISRERGVAPQQVFSTSSGDSLVLKHDGSMTLPKPCYSESVDDEKINIQIQARDMKEAKKMLKGVARKYPKANVAPLLDQAKPQSSYSPDMMHFNLSFGGSEAGRSIIKSALAVVIDAGESVESCLPAIEYLKDENAEACFGYYYEKDLVTNRPGGIPFHCVAVEGDASSGLVLCYIEYFGIQRVVGCLAEKYDGKSFKHSYAIDPISGLELDLTIDLCLPLSEVREAYNYKKIPKGSMEKAVFSIVPVQLEKHQEQEKDIVLNNAIRQAFENTGLKEGEQILPEHAKQIASTISEQLLPLLMHRLGMNKR